MDMQRARVFGSVAQEYDRIRPTYPEAFFDDVVANAALDGLPALDIGAGTGRATLPLARRGIRVTAVEPDADMAAILAERARDLPVEVVVGSFEEFDPPHPYGLLICAQAWHWLDLATRWQRAAAALTVGGTLALCWNEDRFSNQLVEQLRGAYAAQVGPDGTGETRGEPDEFWPQFQAQPDFIDQVYRQYDWSRTMAAADIVAILGTYSQFLILDPPVRAAFFADLTGRLDDEVVVDLRTHGFLARRRG
jgi:SAM-dependent methyltransferase